MGSSIDTPTKLVDAVVLLEAGSAGGKPLPLHKFLGRSSMQRALHQLDKAGCRRCLLLCTSGGSTAGDGIDEQVKELKLQTMTVEAVISVSVEPADQPLSDLLMVFDSRFVLDPRLVSAIAACDSAARLIGDKGEALGMAKLSKETVYPLFAGEKFHALVDEAGGLADVQVGDVPAYMASMRRSFAPYWKRLDAAEDLAKAAKLVMDSAQKGVLDFPARYLHPIPENWLATLASGTAITPNQITVFSAILAFVGTYWFATQQIALALAVAIFAGILDGVDGKLARVKLLSSPFGDWLDHTLDISFEFSWYIAIGWGLYQATGEQAYFEYGFILIAIMLLARALSGTYRLQTGHQIHDHTAFDRAVRLFAGRRNIYVLLLLAGYIIGDFAGAFHWVVIWGMATVAIYALRNIMVLATRVLAWK